MPPEAGPVAVAEVWGRLAEVMDPELDQSVTAMGFVEEVRVAGDEVHVAFRLPTFWCAANFAFLMAHDMKVEVEALPGVRRARVRLLDHFAARKINDGLEAGAGFAAIFGNEAGGDLERLKRTFAEKAFLRRQLGALDACAGALGCPRADAAGLTRAELDAMAAEGDAAVRRYLAIRDAVLGRDAAPAHGFVTLAGDPLPVAKLTDYLRTSRRALGSADANAEMCRIQLQARRSHPVPAPA